jgi:hypothetical protein
MTWFSRNELFRLLSRSHDNGTYRPLPLRRKYRRACRLDWNRSGADDEFGAANFITPSKRQEATVPITEIINVSLRHDMIQAPAVNVTAYLDREVLLVSTSNASDRYPYTCIYHGAIHSPFDTVDCHVMHREHLEH